MPTAYLSKNNRLMQVDEHQGVIAGQLLLSTWYYYNAFGNVTYMVSGLPTGGGSQFMMGGGEENLSPSQGETAEGSESTEELEEALGESELGPSESEELGEGGGSSMLLSFTCEVGDPYTAVRFEYAANGRAVTYAMQEQWCWTGDPEDDPTEYQVNYVEHYRYDGARQRYLVQVLDPQDPDPTDPQNVLDERWSDYDGNNIYADFIIDNGNPLTQDTFEPGVALVTGTATSGDAWTQYYHGDHLGTNLQISASDASPVYPAVYSAFGEPRNSPPAGGNLRYGYVGAFGYQSHEAFSFLHVGHRYYDPASGRFLQRDPIGIRGGLGAYAYVGMLPTSLVDPEGQSPMRRPLPPTGPRIPLVKPGQPPKVLVLTPPSTPSPPPPIRPAVAGAAGAAVVAGLAAKAYVDSDNARMEADLAAGRTRRPARWKFWLWCTGW